MANVIAKLAVMLSANTGAFTSEMEKAGKTTFSLKEQLHHLHKETAGIEKLLKGAGAFGILTFAGEKLNAALEKTSKIMEQVHSGEITAAEGAEGVARSFAESIPVAGEFFKAGEKIREMLDGTAEATAALAAANKDHEERSKAMSEATKVYAKTTATATDEIKRLIQAQEDVAATTGTGPNSDALKLARDMDAVQAKIEEVRKSYIELSQTPGMAAEAEKVGALFFKLKDLKDEMPGVADKLKSFEVGESLNKFFDEVAADAQKMDESITGSLDNFFDSVADGARKMNEDFAKEIQGMVDAAMTPLEKFNQERERAAEALAANLITGDQFDKIVANMRAKLPKEATADFAQIDLAHSAIGRGGMVGIGTKKNIVEDPQLKTTNDLLKQIGDKVGVGRAG